MQGAFLKPKRSATFASSVRITFASVRRFADFWASEGGKRPSSRPYVRSSQVGCERNANVRNAGKREKRYTITHNIYFFFYIYFPFSLAFANSHDCLAAQMLCASRAGACARVRERSRTPQAKEGNDALVSTERPTADHSTTRLADESTAPRRLFQLFSETSGLNPLGPRKTWARRGLHPSGGLRFAGNRTCCAHVAPRSRGGPGAHPLPAPARSRPEAALGAAREFLRFLPGAYQSLGRGKESGY